MKEFKVKVPGVDFELSSNQVYYIREISDSKAPDGYQRKGISKHPLLGIDEKVIVPYHDGTKTWNTGFFEGSYCYANEKSAKAILKKITDNLLPELKYLVEGDLTNGKSSNNNLFDDFPPFNSLYGEEVSKYKIKGGNVYNTENPLEFLTLWWALIGGQVVPENNKNFTKCSYVLESKKQSTTNSQDKEYEKTVALSTVMSVVTGKNKKEKDRLQYIFTYVGLNMDISSVENKPLISTFSKWCEKGGFNNDNAVEFNEVYEEFKGDTKLEELIVYSKMADYIKTSKIIVDRKDIILEGTNLGSNKKEACRAIVADQELHKLFLSLK